MHVYQGGLKRLRHPDVGELELAHEVMALPGNDGLTVCTCSAEPGSNPEDGLKLLEGLSATEVETGADS